MSNEFLCQKQCFLVTKQMPLEWFGLILDKFEIDMWPYAQSQMPRQEFLRRIRGKTGVLLGFGSKQKIDSEALDAAGDTLKIVSTLSVGYDHIDVNECRKRGVRVGHTPNVLNEAVAELAIGLVLATIRRFMEANKCLRESNWICDPFWMTGSTVGGSVVGFIGAGRIGSSIMAKVKAFQPSRILYHCRNRNPKVEQDHRAEYEADLNRLLSQTDILIIICPLNEATKHLLSYEQFSLMKPTSTVINVSRGSVIDQKALVYALQTKRIRSAGLDVMEIEPLPLNDPLLTMDNVVLLPHIGSAVKQTRKQMIKLAIDNLIAGLNDQTLKAEI